MATSPFILSNTRNTGPGPVLDLKGQYYVTGGFLIPSADFIEGDQMFFSLQVADDPNSTTQWSEVAEINVGQEPGLQPGRVVPFSFGVGILNALRVNVIAPPQQGTVLFKLYFVRFGSSNPPPPPQ